MGPRSPPALRPKPPTSRAPVPRRPRRRQARSGACQRRHPRRRRAAAAGLAPRAPALSSGAAATYAAIDATSATIVSRSRRSLRPRRATKSPPSNARTLGGLRLPKTHPSRRGKHGCGRSSRAGGAATLRMRSANSPRPNCWRTRWLPRRRRSRPAAARPRPPAPPPMRGARARRRRARGPWRGPRRKRACQRAPAAAPSPANHPRPWRPR
mmetsp:Transcript_160581/g.515458  ORF Transcript_160581/g.515458 Transcript_160581/m.515458 type:complete len:211 (-) Transcript_160581:462-1094(-)